MFSHQTLILGIGSPGLADDDAGTRALRAFEKFHPGLPGVTCIDFGPSQAAVREPLAGARHLIVFDVAQFDASPGTIRCLVGKEMDDYLHSDALNADEAALAQLIDMVRIHGSGPIRRALIGIQRDSDGGAASTAVDGALPWAAALARELVERWNSEKEAGTTANRLDPAEPDSHRDETHHS